MNEKKHPVGTDHPSLKHILEKVKRCRDACDGTDAIKAAQEIYLPRPSGMSKTVEKRAKYTAYLKRALFLNAARRTRIGISGAATLSEPSIATNERGAEFVEHLRRMLPDTIDEILETSRCAVTVTTDRDGLPFPTLWIAESVRNWRWSFVRGKYELSLLVLSDEESDPMADVYSSDTIKVRHSYRVSGVPGTESARVVYEKFRWEKDAEDWLPMAVNASGATDTELTAAGGRPLNLIPAAIFGAMSFMDPTIEDPVLIDLVDVNLSHYMNSADLEHGRHWTALVTAWAAGFPTIDANGNEVALEVGGDSAWVTENASAKCGYLEFTGAGLGHLADALRAKEENMAMLGARLLEQPKAAVEAAETIRNRMIGDRSVIGRVMSTVSQAMTWALRRMQWMATAGYVEQEGQDTFKVEPDFLREPMTAGELQALTGALQSGGISFETFFARLQQARVVPPERKVEEERALIDRGAPGPRPIDPFAASPADESLPS